MLLLAAHLADPEWIISRPQSNAPSWSVTNLLPLQDRRIPFWDF